MLRLTGSAPPEPELSPSLRALALMVIAGITEACAWLRQSDSRQLIGALSFLQVYGGGATARQAQGDHRVGLMVGFA